MIGRNNAPAGGSLTDFFGDGSDGYWNSLNPRPMDRILNLTTLGGPVTGIDNLKDGNPDTKAIWSDFDGSNDIFSYYNPDYNLCDKWRLKNVKPASTCQVRMIVYYSSNNSSWNIVGTGPYVTYDGVNPVDLEYAHSGERNDRYFKIAVETNPNIGVGILEVGELELFATNIKIKTTDDDMPAILQCEDFNLSVGQTLAVSNRCEGLIIYSKGDITINGEILMGSKAPLARNQWDGRQVLLKYKAVNGFGIEKFNQLSTALLTMRGGKGGNGGQGGGRSGSYRSSGGSVEANTERVNVGGFAGCGGGGAFFENATYAGGNAGSINRPEMGIAASINLSAYWRAINTSSYTYYIGFSGSVPPGFPGWSYRYIGQYASSGSASLPRPTYGAGSRGSTHGDAGTNGGYAGGFVLLIAGGNINIGAPGKIDVSGAPGVSGGSASKYDYSGGGAGGGAGGGVVGILHKGSFTNDGTIDVSGGAAGAKGNDSADATYTFEGGFAGTAGSIGQIYEVQL